MITYLKSELYTWGRNKNQTRRLVQIACKAKDNKPINDIVTGSICIEVDTGNIFMFDEEGAQWTLIE